MKYEKWSFGYYLLKKYVQFADWIIYRKVIKTGEDKIPKNQPIVFAPNHQNALSDPMAILLHTKFQPVWLARADIFGNKIIAFILRFLKIMPVYRMRDGKENLSKNDHTFSSSIKVLENNFALGLFPEAAHTGKRQMITHKKAVPRIVFMAEEKAEKKLNIQIIPTGIYYSSYWKFNRDLIVNFGNPISVNDYLDEYENNPNAAILLLRDRIYEEILPLVINIKSTNYYDEFETLREIYGPHYLKRQNIKNTTLNLFRSNQILVGKLDELEVKKPVETEKLIEMVMEYDSTIKKMKIRSWLADNPYFNFLKIGLNKLILLAGLPFFIFGFIFNAIPFFLIDTVVRKSIKDVAFWSTFSLVAGLILFPIFYVIEINSFWWALPDLPYWVKLLVYISLPFAGKIAFRWYILLRKTIGRIRLFLIQMFRIKQYYNLFKQKELLIKKLDELISA